jgi:hypothetical protein
MPERTTIYRVSGDGNLQEIKPVKLDYEERIQSWVEKDVGIISENLLVIGREVETSYGGFIDILCIDSQGDIVIIELKRGMTPREVTAQTLDYASWVNDLSHDEITRIADEYVCSNREIPESAKKIPQYRVGNSVTAG